MNRDVKITRYRNGWIYYAMIYTGYQCGWRETGIKSLFKPICYLKLKIWWLIHHRDDKCVLKK